MNLLKQRYMPLVLILSGLAVIALATDSLLLPHFLGLVLLVFFLLGYKTLYRSVYIQGVCWLGLLLAALFVTLYRPPTFHFPLIFAVDALHDDGKPFALYVNIAKALAGYILLVGLWNAPSYGCRFLSAPKAIPLMCIFIAAVVFNALVCLDLQFEPKRLIYVVLFALVNLLVTCVAEEVFLRLLLQRQIGVWVEKALPSTLVGIRWWREVLPLVIVTLVFFPMHGLGWGELMWVYGFAGVVYGLTYTLTKSIWLSIMVHFGVNILHFSFLTYPL